MLIILLLSHIKLGSDSRFSQVNSDPETLKNLGMDSNLRRESDSLSWNGAVYV